MKIAPRTFQFAFIFWRKQLILPILFRLLICFITNKKGEKITRAISKLFLHPEDGARHESPPVVYVHCLFLCVMAGLYGGLLSGDLVLLREVQTVDIWLKFDMYNFLQDRAGGGRLRHSRLERRLEWIRPTMGEAASYIVIVMLCHAAPHTSGKLQRRCLLPTRRLEAAMLATVSTHHLRLSGGAAVHYFSPTHLSGCDHTINLSRIGWVTHHPPRRHVAYYPQTDSNQQWWRQSGWGVVGCCSSFNLRVATPLPPGVVNNLSCL